MNRFARWFKRQGVQENPSLILKLGGLLFLAMILGAWGIFPDAMAIIGVLLGFCIFLLGVLTLFLAALRGPLVEDETPPVFIVPGEPGHRVWAHDVYDENAYAILGVAQDVTRAEIREAFRKLVPKYHPDAVPVEEKERAALVFVRLDQAFELLSHTENRARYDAWIEHLHGREPPLDEACAVFNNSESRRLFDTEIMSKVLAKEGPTANRSMPRETVHRSVAETMSKLPPNSLVPPEQRELVPPAERGDSPPEVDIPDAVRDALGLPSAAQTSCIRCGQPLRDRGPGQAHCARCSEREADTSKGLRQ